MREHPPSATARSLAAGRDLIREADKIISCMSRDAFIEPATHRVIAHLRSLRDEMD